MDKALQQALQKDVPVYFFYGSEAYLLRRATREVEEKLLTDGVEATVLEGPAPDIGEVVMAAGAISLFGTRRLVEMPLLAPASYSDKALDELFDLLKTAENAVFLITSQPADKKAMQGKRFQKFVQFCARQGLAQELAPPVGQKLCALLQQHAQQQGATLPAGVAQQMVQRSGTDLFLLENEVDKLAALAGYGEITAEMVRQLGTAQLEAETFDMVRSVTAGDAPRALQKLQQLLQMQNEPIAITAALAGSYVDMYRVKCGSVRAVFKDFGYRGSDYRLKKSAESAARYTKEQLAACLEILLRLDTQLKSAPVDGEVLLESALCQLAAVRVR